MLPTNIAKPKVLSIQAFVSSDVKSRKTSSIDAKTSKPLRIKTPKTIPLKSESSTLLVYRAKAMAKKDGNRERTDGSMIKTHKLTGLSLVCQISLCRVHTLFVLLL
jgi:hypothetical protein